MNDSKDVNDVTQLAVFIRGRVLKSVITEELLELFPCMVPLLAKTFL
jgi:hypothetical protein